MEIQKADIDDLSAITNLVTEVSIHDVLPLFSEQGKLEYEKRVLPDLVSTFDEEKFFTIKALSSGELVGYIEKVVTLLLPSL